jgi:threonine synthase
MKYISTRSNLELKSFSEVVISGTAKDGGLYVPKTLPIIDQNILKKDLGYTELATEIISLFANDIDKKDIERCCKIAYADFKNDVAPLRKLEENLYLLELFQGPTISFKDYAMQFLGRVIDLVLSEKKIKKQIILATSGDTGPAAIFAFSKCKWVTVKVYYPKAGVSMFQEDQMLSIKQDNIEVVGMDCTFDECQKIVKKEFENSGSDNLMTVNSINIARIISQIVYYFYSYINLECRPVEFFVPTGNFGNVFAGFFASKLGIDAKFSICVNENDTLYRFYNSGVFEPRDVVATASNAIDISNPSNFERILWYLSDDKSDVSKYMESLKKEGRYKISWSLLNKFKEIFTVYRIDRDEVVKTQKFCEEKYGVKICPHTALALKSALSKDGLRVVLATASYLKF